MSTSGPIRIFSEATAVVTGGASGIGRAVAKALDAVAKNKAIIVLPRMYKLFWWINRFFPSLGIFLGRLSYQNGQKKLGLS